MELLVHASTSGHLLVACSLEVVTAATKYLNVHVIMATPHTAHLLLWVETIFVRALFRTVGNVDLSFMQILYSGMEDIVRVVAHAVSSTTHHGSPRT